MQAGLTECQHLKQCPVFSRFRSEGLANVWIVSYCRGPKQAACERLKLKALGREVPEDLLPDGKRLPSLGRPGGAS